MSPRTDVGDVPVMTPGQVLDLLGGAVATEDVGPLAGPPLVAVDVDDAGAHGLAAVVRDRPCVVVGVGSLPRTLASPPGLDVLLTDVPGAPRPWRSCAEGLDRALSTLSLGVLCAPRAATALVQLLRMGRGLSVADALVAESLAHALLRSGSEFGSWLETRTPADRTRDATPVEVTRRDATLTVTLHRPHARNAIDAATSDALAAAFEVAASDPSIERVELRGSGPAFCSGTDLDEIAVGDAVTDHLARVSRSPVLALRRCADRTTAHVQGACIGVGLELVAGAGRVVAAADATFQLPDLRVGLSPGAGGTVTVAGRIGRPRMAWMALSGAPLDVRTALDWGLVDIA